MGHTAAAPPKVSRPLLRAKSMCEAIGSMIHGIIGDHLARRLIKVEERKGGRGPVEPVGKA